MAIKIRPIHVGTLHTDKSAMTYMRNYGISYNLPCIIWYIEGASKKILVDTGSCTPEWANKHHLPMSQTFDQTPAAALKANGVDPESIDTVLLTHLHYDHAFNNHLFKNAEFFVQADELTYAINPLPIHAKGYEAVRAGMSPQYYTNTKYTVIKGDVDIVPDVSVINTPGHTPGSMCVVVKAGAPGQKYIIASDTIPTYDNLEGNPPVPAIPNTYHINLIDYFDSFNKLTNTGGIILPGHDMAVLKQPCYPFP